MRIPQNPVLDTIRNDAVLSALLLFVFSLGINIAIVFAIAWPFSVAWKAALVPIGLPDCGYWRSAGLLSLVSLVKVAWNGFTLEAKYR